MSTRGNDGFSFVDMNVPCTKECWKVKGEYDPVLEVWESYNGDLYFITEKDEETGEIFMYARLYAMPQFAEWGSNNINYLREQYGCDKLWQVPRKNWPNIETYEKGLLMRVDHTCDECGEPTMWCAKHKRYHHTASFKAECEETLRIAVEHRSAGRLAGAQTHS